MDSIETDIKIVDGYINDATPLPPPEHPYHVASDAWERLKVLLRAEKPEIDWALEKCMTNGNEEEDFAPKPEVREVFKTYWKQC